MNTTILVWIVQYVPVMMLSMSGTNLFVRPLRAAPIYTAAVQRRYESIRRLWKAEDREDFAEFNQTTLSFE